MRIRPRPMPSSACEPAAGNGLLDRRILLRSGLAIAGGVAGAPLARSEPLEDDPWSLVQGSTTTALEPRSRFEQHVARTLTNPNGEPRTQHARSPLHLLHGTITPNELHFTIVHNGTPDIDPARHRLVVHGMVKRPLLFTLDKLARYPMTTRMAFVECAGNSAPLFSKEPIQATVQALHGLVSNAEWTGVPLSILLDEAGLDPKAKWVIAEGADTGALSRSIPLGKCMDDALVALYQNGERIRPGNGYPMRLLLPGFEGNMNVKWLRRLLVTDQPAMTYFESRNYSPLLPDGKAYRFYFINEVKSFITHPSFGHALEGPGYYEISGLAYSGTGRIARVLLSADGGTSWAEAALQEPRLPMAFTRFRMPWRWDGEGAILQSRAWDEAGNSQPLRADFVAVRGQSKTVPKITAFTNQHYNSVTSWRIDRNGEVKHVYA